MVKSSPTNAGDTRDKGLLPRLGRSPREGNGNPLQHSCLGNPTDIGAWQAVVHGVAKVRHDLATKQQGIKDWSYPPGVKGSQALPPAGSSYWLHVAIIWEAYRKYRCLGPTSTGHD